MYNVLRCSEATNNFVYFVERKQFYIMFGVRFGAAYA